jgi:carbohydrate kinase (thermoresistant glucokinase family)
MRDTEPRAVILMGVSGSGKSTVGASLAQRLECPFLDADDFHPAANVEKMKHGIPLNDEDRMPWLRRLHEELEHRLGSGASVVLGCSALKESYRKILEEGLSRIDFVFLDVDQVTLTERLGKRKDHFFPKELLESQFAALEMPSDAIVVDARLPFQDVVEQILNALKKKQPAKDG